MLRGGSPWYEDEGRKERDGEDLGLSTLSYIFVLFGGIISCVTAMYFL